MDDLALLKDMADDTPLPSVADLAPARARLMTSMTPAPRRRRRLFLAGAGVIGLAAAITGVMALGGFGVAPPSASAADVLHQAAAAARAQPDVEPRPDQFIYAKIYEPNGTFEVWRSVAGTREGLTIGADGAHMPQPACTGGPVKSDDGEYLPGACSFAFEASLPTDKAGMLAYLRDVRATVPTHDIKAVGLEVERIMSVSYVRPATLAALYDALAELDEMSLVEHATDAAGREGVGVRWTNDGTTETLVFDAETHAYLGMTDVAATLATSVVDEVGER